MKEAKQKNFGTGRQAIFKKGESASICDHQIRRSSSVISSSLSRAGSSGAASLRSPAGTGETYLPQRHRSRRGPKGPGIPSPSPTARADTEGSGNRARPGGDSKARLAQGGTETRVGPAPGSASPTPTSWQPDDSPNLPPTGETSPLRVAGRAAGTTSASGAPRVLAFCERGISWRR